MGDGECNHAWFETGGTNVGCSPDCDCSVPVFECSLCGECDYGDNIYATTAVENCHTYWRVKKQVSAHYDTNEDFGRF